MLKFDTKPPERGKRVYDESTPIAGVVIPLVGTGLLLDGTVDAEPGGDSVVCPPRMRFSRRGSGH